MIVASLFPIFHALLIASRNARKCNQALSSEAASMQHWYFYASGPNLKLLFDWENPKEVESFQKFSTYEEKHSEVIIFTMTLHKDIQPKVAFVLVCDSK